MWVGARMRGHSIQNAHEKVKKHVMCLSQTLIAFPTELFMASGASWPRINMKIGSQPLLGVVFCLVLYASCLVLVIVIQLVTIIIYLLGLSFE